MGLIDEVSIHRKNIKYDTITFSISELVNMYRGNEIHIQPDFQRLFRWSREQQSLFIESLLLEIPIPPLFFYESKDTGQWNLIDGLQRLSTILKFIAAEQAIPESAKGIVGNDDEWHDNKENDLSFPLQLLPGEYLAALAGTSFQTLPASLQLNLRRARINIYVLKRETDVQYQYEVFKRLNTGGSALVPQELRNCSVRMLGNEFPNFLQAISHNQDFIDSIGLDESYGRNAFFDELALRFFTMKNNYRQFTHDVELFMTHYMEGVQKKKLTFDYDHEERLFKEVFALLNKAAKEMPLFRSRDLRDPDKLVGAFSSAIFEMVTVGTAENLAALSQLPPRELAVKIRDLVVEAKKTQLIGSGTNSKKKTLGRMELGINWLAL